MRSFSESQMRFVSNFETSIGFLQFLQVFKNFRWDPKWNPEADLSKLKKVSQLKLFCGNFTFLMINNGL